MPTVKTAISIDKSLFQQAEALAREMRMPRSRLFVLALEEFIQRRESQEMMVRLNEAYSESPDEAERTLIQTARRTHRRVVDGEW